MRKILILPKIGTIHLTYLTCNSSQPDAKSITRNHLIVHYAHTYLSTAFHMTIVKLIVSHWYYISLTDFLTLILFILQT